MFILQLSQWTVPAKLKVFAGLGGGSIDFRRASFVHDVTRVSIFGFAGGVNLVVPPGVRVEPSVCHLAGGGEIKEVSPRGDTDRPGAPVIVFSGLWLCGGCNVIYATTDDKLGDGCC